jgi:hypothetical protein
VGRGKRWLAVWLDPYDREKSRAFSSKTRADKYASEMETDVARGEYADPLAGTFASMRSSRAGSSPGVSTRRR